MLGKGESRAGVDLAEHVCVAAVAGLVSEALDLEIRAGVHTGECEVSDGKIVGVAVSVLESTPEVIRTTMVSPRRLIYTGLSTRGEETGWLIHGRALLTINSPRPGTVVASPVNRNEPPRLGNMSS